MIRVHLIDASPYAFRAFFSLPDSIRSPGGAPVNAVYGFASFLIKLIADEAPTHLALAFDESLTSSFRNEIYPAYKQQRALPPAELEAQLGACREVGEALGIACYSDERLEADDILATLAVQLAAAGHEVVVVSNDKDLAQLVGPRVTFYDFAKGDRLGPAEVHERWGVEPRQVPDLLGLQGDAVDNIPGVPGVGKKTAQALLERYRDLDHLYEHLDQVPSLALRGAASLARKLAEHRDQAFLSRQLATAVTDGAFPADLEKLELKGADPEKVDLLFERLGFQGIRARIPRWR
ncbi:MAG TPA: 5'-3' exonuclease H3TH domain-containing protein [Thermoanaerobaculia bacterium]|nr:5'-3' exonuclease H3TH domain-containing protein [Thermoanaerobaculia bacterium]